MIDTPSPAVAAATAVVLVALTAGCIQDPETMPTGEVPDAGAEDDTDVHDDTGDADTRSCGPGLTWCEQALDGAGGCVDTDTDPAHCGDCSSRCEAADGETAVCETGSCTVVCDHDAGFVDCEGDGECLDLDSDPDHCGSCGRKCPTGECDDGTCAPLPCSQETGDDQPFGGGSGTPDDPYTLCSASHLQSLAQQPSPVDDHFALSDDIDYQDLGEDQDFEMIEVFEGSFDGFGHTISNLTIETDRRLAGLFIYLQPPAKIEHLSLEGLSVDHDSGHEDLRTGGVVAENLGTITDVEVDGQLTGEASVGGIAGRNHGWISEATSTATIQTPDDGWGWELGGLTGANWGHIHSSESSATVEATGSAVGGAMGYNAGVGADLNVDTSIDFPDGEESTTIGGLVGHQEAAQATLVNSTVSAAIDAPASTSNVGGAVGHLEDGASITDITVDDISVEGGTDVGGIVGRIDDATLDASFVSGDVEADAAGPVGGAVGTLAGNSTLQQIDTDVETTTETADLVGGLVGALQQGATIRESRASGEIDVPVPPQQDRSEKIVGGLVGLHSDTATTIETSRADGSVSVHDPQAVAVGGLIGVFEGTGHVADSASEATVTSSANHTGGLVGWVRYIGNNANQLVRTYATGDVDGGDDGNTGGLVGRANSHADIVDSYATADASGGGDVGSMIGLLQGATHRCYAVGEPIGTPVGNEHGSVVDSYGLRPDDQGDDQDEADRLLTRDQFGDESHFQTWDLDDVWNLVDVDDLQADDEQLADEFSRPRLQWEFDD